MLTERTAQPATDAGSRPPADQYELPSRSLDGMPADRMTRRALLQRAAFSASLLTGVVKLSSAGDSAPLSYAPVTCEGRYPGHLQGICTDHKSNIFWSFTTQIVKTDAHGKILRKVQAPSHQGDLCYLEDKLYVAVNLGKFNRPAGQADSWVYVYDAGTLKMLSRHPVQEAVHGAGGMDSHNGHFYVVGGLPGNLEENYVFEYDPEFQFVKRHIIASGQTLLGIQTATFHDGFWWMGCYGKPAELLKTGPDFKLLSRTKFNCALGLAGYGKGQFLVARGHRDKNGNSGRIVPGAPDEKNGLRVVTT